MGTEESEGQKCAKKKWTVMVFMGATTFEGNADLNKPADDDLKEMEAIGSDDPCLNIFVERHDNKNVFRYHVGKPTTDDWPGLVKGAKSSIKSGQALREFVKQALTTAEHHREDYTMLVLWGHSYDFAFGRKRERDGTVDALDFAEFGDRLKEIQADMKAKYLEEGTIAKNLLPTLDIVGFDACDISSVEMACQLYPYADYLLGSEVGIPLPGWPYDRILDPIKWPRQPPEGPQRSMGPAEFGTYIVRRFCESYQAKDDAVSLTLLDLAHTAELALHAERLAEKLAIAIGDPASLSQIADLFSRSQTDRGRPYVDVADLCVNLVRESGDGDVVAAATALGDFLVSPPREVAGLSETGEGRSLVVEHGRNAGRLARLNGISLYAPHVAPDTDVDGAEPFYEKFTFAGKNHWKDLVHAMARS